MQLKVVTAQYSHIVLCKLLLLLHYLMRCREQFVEGQSILDKQGEIGMKLGIGYM